MWTIAKDMAEAAQRLGVTVSVLEDVAGAAVRDTAKARFGRRRGGWPLWDGPPGAADVSVELRGDVARLATAIGSLPCLIFWESRSERQVLRFASGADMVAVLLEVHRTEFYVTDDDVSYLLCFNHHGFLIGFGPGGLRVAQCQARVMAPVLHSVRAPAVCGRCGAETIVTYTARPRGWGIRFAASSRCGACSSASELDGDALTDEARQAFYDAEGRWCLVLRDLGPRRSDVLRALRDNAGISMQTVSQLAARGGTIVTGTLVEIEGPQEILSAAGASVAAVRYGENANEGSVER